jgi:ATP-binding cassette subfamily B protein
MDTHATADFRPLAADLFEVLARHRLRVACAFVLLVAAKLATVAVPLVLKRIIDAFAQPAALSPMPLYLLGGYALLRFLSTLLNEWRDLLFKRVTLGTVAAYAQRTFAHLHALGPRFHASRKLGELLPDIDRGTNGIAFLLGVGLFTIVPTLLEIGLVLAIMLARYSAAFAAIIAFTFLAYAAFTLLFTARRVPHQRRVNKLDSRSKGQLADSLLNHDTVKYFGNEAVEAERFGAIMGRWRRAGMGNQRALFELHTGQSALIALGVAAIMLLAGQAVWHGAMSVGDLVLINAYALQVCLPLNALGFVYREAKDAWTNTEKLFALLREAPEMPDPPGQPVLRPEWGEVVFEQVRFGYEPGRPVLQDISFRIAPGHTTAVVGRSGSGKSTLARLLLRFYDPDAGRILIDGQDIRTVSAASVRRAIGVVPQEAGLFNDSIGYNIAYGFWGSAPAEVAAAAAAAHLQASIDALPRKFDTPVGERGLALSGGERQRVGIARAILKNPPILVFDEATSALDADSEHAIEQELRRLARDRSTLVIAHRLSSIVRAHEILVMDAGRIVERGTHRQLLKANGLYARLWGLQQAPLQATRGPA